MNIQNKLRTIERKMNINASEYCRCYGERLKYEVIPISIDEWKRRFDAGEERHERLPDFCDRCRKPIDKRFIETTFEQFQETQARRINQAMETFSKFED